MSNLLIILCRRRRRRVLHPLPLLLLVIFQPLLILLLILLHPVDIPDGPDIVFTSLPDLELVIEARVRVRDVAFRADEAFGFGAGDAVTLHYCLGKEKSG